MKKLALLLIIFIIVSSSIYSQNYLPWFENQSVGSTLSPNPDAAQLTKHNSLPLNYATGSPIVNIPLYNFNLNGNSHSISLNYSTNGFKPNVPSGRYGQDWSLMVGGVINRTINDVDDFEYSVRAIPNENFLNSDTSLATRTFVANYIQHPNNTIKDTEYDFFDFNFAGYSGRFIIVNDTIVPLGNYGLKFDRSLGYFRITDNDGVIYIFLDSETSGTVSDGVNCNVMEYTNNITSIYLSSIVYPNGSNLMFYYNNYYTNYAANISSSETRLKRSSITPDLDTCHVEDISLESYTRCTTYVQSSIQVLDRIESSNGLRVKFYYRERFDILNEKILDRIEVLDVPNSNILSKYKLNYFEFNSTTSSGGEPDIYNNEMSSRHFLKDVIFQDSSENELNRYSFTYTSLDPISRITTSIDYWGYFNSNTSSNQVYIDNVDNRTSYLYSKIINPANRNIDHNQSRKNTLNKIIYPTKGKDSIVYEGNGYDFSGMKQVYTPTTELYSHQSQTGDFLGIPSLYLYFNQMVLFLT